MKNKQNMQNKKHKQKEHNKTNNVKTVSIISRESDSRTLDISMLEAELLKRGVRVNVLSRLLTKEKSLKALCYAGHVLKQEAAILRSDIVVLDTYCIPASMIPHRSGTKVIQMWHALSAIKKFGWQTVGMEGGSSPKLAKLMRMHRGYDYVVSPSDITAEHFSEAFRTDPSKIVKYGLPRIDYIKSVAAGEKREAVQRKIYSRYPELAGSGRKLVLYAPTFRRGSAVDVRGLVSEIDKDRFDIVVKLHPLYRVDTDEADKRNESQHSAGADGCLSGETAKESVKGAVIYDDDFSSYDWLAVADVIISDYSSFVVESSLADRPLYIYAYDLEEYEKNTGLNMDFDEEPIAPYVFRDAGSLAKALDREYDFDALHAFRDRYIDIDTENCTAALADFIVSQAAQLH